jgi:hypothetical protein
MKVYYFYKCNDERFAGNYDYYDYSLGIAGYTSLQERPRYIGVGTIELLAERMKVEKARKGLKHNRRGYNGNKMG